MEAGRGSIRVLLVDVGSARTEINEPIGIGALSSYLRAHLKSRVTVRQHFVQLSGLIKGIELAEADVVGVSTRLATMGRLQEVLASWHTIPKPWRPVLVLGGVIATFATEELLQRAPEAICVVGEGEEALVGIVDGVVRGNRDGELLRRFLLNNHVPNVAFVLKGDLCTTPRRLLDLASSPAPDRQFAKAVAQVGGIVRAEASRGCAWGRCEFCAIQYKYCNSISWRPVPTDRVIRELEELSALGIRSPFYTDEDFVGNDPLRTVELARGIRAAREGGRIAPEMNLYIDARVDTVLALPRDGVPSGKDVFRELRAAGLREVFLGVESGAKEQVRRYGKPATASRNLAAIELLQGLGLTLDIGFIMFDPEMNLSELRANLEFVEAAGLRFHDARLTKKLRVEPGTPVLRNYGERNLLTGPLDIDDLTYPYRWLDSRVAAVHDRFAIWERERSDVIYELQARTRGEVGSEAIRGQRRRHLGDLRSLDLDVLWSLVGAAENNRDPSQVDLSAFSQIRDCLLRSENGLHEETPAA